MRVITNPFEICEALGVGMKGRGELGFALAVDDDGKPLHLLIGGGSGWRFSEATATTTVGGPGSGGAHAAYSDAAAAMHTHRPSTD